MMEPGWRMRHPSRQPSRICGDRTESAVTTILLNWDVFVAPCTPIVASEMPTGTRAARFQAMASSGEGAHDGGHDARQQHQRPYTTPGSATETTVRVRFNIRLEHLGEGRRPTNDAGSAGVQLGPRLDQLFDRIPVLNGRAARHCGAV